MTRGHRAPLGRAGCSGCVLGPRRPRVGSRQERRIPGARPELRPSVSKAFQESGERRKKKKKKLFPESGLATFAQKGLKKQGLLMA